jgi:hypothetical protein
VRIGDLWDTYGKSLTVIALHPFLRPFPDSSCHLCHSVVNCKEVNRNLSTAGHLTSARAPFNLGVNLEIKYHGSLPIDRDRQAAGHVSVAGLAFVQSASFVLLHSFKISNDGTEEPGMKDIAGESSFLVGAVLRPSCSSISEALPVQPGADRASIINEHFQKRHFPAISIE